MRFRLIVLLSLSCCSPYLLAQNKPPNQSVSLKNENDVFLLKGKDRYYSNGIFIHYHWVHDTYHSESTVVKKIIDVGLKQQMWTPQSLLFSNFSEFDRPYAGLLLAQINFNEFKRMDRRLSYGLEFGTSGKASGNQVFQEFYHKTFGLPEPRGWEHQIPNAFVFNLMADYMHQVKFSESADFIFATQAKLGTGFINALQRVDLRLGQLRSLSTSSFANSFLGKDAHLTAKNNFIFIGYGLEFVLYNITLEGPMNKEAMHTEEVVPWVHHFRLGFVRNTNKNTFKLTFNWLSPEVPGIKNHAYVGLAFFFRWAA